MASQIKGNPIAADVPTGIYVSIVRFKGINRSKLTYPWKDPFVLVNPIIAIANVCEWFYVQRIQRRKEREWQLKMGVVSIASMLLIVTYENNCNDGENHNSSSLLGRLFGLFSSSWNLLAHVYNIQRWVSSLVCLKKICIFLLQVEKMVDLFLVNTVLPNILESITDAYVPEASISIFLTFLILILMSLLSR